MDGPCLYHDTILLKKNMNFYFHASAMNTLRKSVGQGKLHTIDVESEHRSCQHSQFVAEGFQTLVGHVDKICDHPVCTL